MACIECGSCAYVCPAAIPLVQHIRLAKSRIAAARRQRREKGKEKEAVEAAAPTDGSAGRQSRLPTRGPHRWARHTPTARCAGATLRGRVQPHLRAGDTVPSIMWTVVAALLPAAAVGVFYFGLPGLIVLVIASAGCVAFEALFQRLMGRTVTVSDGSAALTGLLLGMNLPPASPAWMVLVGCAVAIFLGKLVFGGLGFNPSTRRSSRASSC